MCEGQRTTFSVNSLLLLCAPQESNSGPQVWWQSHLYLLSHLVDPPCLLNIKSELHRRSATKLYFSPEFVGCNKETDIAPLWVKVEKVIPNYQGCLSGKQREVTEEQIFRVVRDWVPEGKGTCELAWGQGLEMNKEFL